MSGRWHAKDKANFYFISRGSAFECVPLIELGFELGLIAEVQKAELRDDLQSIMSNAHKIDSKPEMRVGRLSL